jgi:hypothetical protein
MKSLNIFILTVFVYGSLKAQQFQKNYLGEDYIFYQNSFFKIDHENDYGFNYCFYEKLEYCQQAYYSKVMYPNPSDKYKTSKDSLINRIFQVTSIIKKNGEKLNGEISYDDPVFILKDTLTKQEIYFKYDKKSESSFPFLTTKTTYSSSILCNQIDRTVDEFTNEVQISTPYSLNSGDDVMLLKYIKNGKTIYYLSLETNGSTLNYATKGVSILFEDGTKFSKPTAAIDVDVADYGYKYSAFITLTLLEAQTFTKKRIKKFRLYIYDGEVSSQAAEKFTIYSKCVIDKK